MVDELSAKRPRGRPPKPKPKSAPRTKSPFLVDSARLRRITKELKARAGAEESGSRHLDLSDMPVELSGIRTALTAEQTQTALITLERLRSRDVDPYAPNSRRSMHADWRHWLMFCVQQDRIAMPIAFEDLTEFLDALIDAGYRRATLDHLISTLSTASKLWSCPGPTSTFEFRAYWRDRCSNRLLLRQRQAPALNVEEVQELQTAISEDSSPRELRDTTFVAVAYDLMARASELVALRWDSIQFLPEGDATYCLSRSKTDQQGEGRVLHLRKATVMLLTAWRAHAFPTNPYVFHALPRYAGQEMEPDRPLAVREVARIFKRVARRAGIEGSLSGHSARVGGAQDMVRAGLDLPAIMQKGRWASPRMPARYAENELAARAGRDIESRLENLVARSNRSKAPPDKK